MAVKLSFLKVLHLICAGLLEVNYFAADKGKSLISKASTKALMIFPCMYAKSHKSYFQMISYMVL